VPNVTITDGQRLRSLKPGAVDRRFGARVRQLRVGRGLTQAELAGAHFSKGFISLIETGRTRVSPRAASILAGQLGVSTADLLSSSASEDPETELQILLVEQRIASHHAADGLRLIDPALKTATGTLRARALRSRGRALLELGRPRDALPSLLEATDAFQALGEEEMRARTLYERALAHAHLDEPGTVLSLALECEAAVRAGGYADRTLLLQVRSLLATTFARMGDPESADFQARRALELVKEVSDPDALATLYSTLSGTRHSEGDLEAAVSYARKSLAIFEDLGRARAVGQLWHNLASVYLTRKDYAKAADAIARARRIAQDNNIGSLEARLLSLSGELELAQRRWRSARTFAEAAVAHADASAITRGRAYLTIARVAGHDKASLGEIRSALDAALDAFSTEPARIRAEAHETYGQILAVHGQWKAAYERASTALGLFQSVAHSSDARSGKPASSSRAVG
jgi:tetratricopeptide (TPR) repeat protein